MPERILSRRNSPNPTFDNSNFSFDLKTPSPKAPAIWRSAANGFQVNHVGLAATAAPLKIKPLLELAAIAKKDASGDAAWKDSRYRFFNRVISTESATQSTSQRELFRRSIYALREQLLKGENREPAQRKAYELWMQVCCNSFARPVVQTFIHMGTPHMERAETLSCSSQLQREFEAIDRAKDVLGINSVIQNMKNLQGHLSFAFDPMTLGNLPHLLGTQTFGDQTVSWIRAGTPTLQDYWGTASITPEYKAAVEEARKQGKKVMHFVHQNPTPKTRLQGDESLRVNAIKAFAETQDNYFAVCLPLDGAFFTRRNAPDQMQIVDFTDEFKKELCSPNSLFHFPKGLKEDAEFQRALDTLFTEVGRSFFTREKLSKQEQETFTLITYVFLKHWLKKKFDISFFHSTCKDGIDRAGIMNSLEFYLHGYMHKDKMLEDPIWRRAWSFVTHVGSIFVKKQAIIPHRREHLLKVLEHLETLPNRDQAKQSAFLKELSPSEMKVKSESY